MENVIYNELRSRGYSVDVGVVENVGKENGVSVRKSLEVDFVVDSGNRRYYIQAAYNIHSEEKMKQKQALLLSINDAFRKIIIINQPILSGYNEQRLLELRWWDYGANILKGLDLLDVDGAISKIQNRIKNGFEKYVCKKIIINGEVLRKQE